MFPSETYFLPIVDLGFRNLQNQLFMNPSAFQSFPLSFTPGPIDSPLNIPAWRTSVPRLDIKNEDHLELFHWECLLQKFQHQDTVRVKHPSGNTLYTWKGNTSSKLENTPEFAFPCPGEHNFRSVYNSKMHLFSHPFSQHRGSLRFPSAIPKKIKKERYAAEVFGR